MIGIFFGKAKEVGWFQIWAWGLPPHEVAQHYNEHRDRAKAKLAQPQLLSRYFPVKSQETN